MNNKDADYETERKKAFLYIEDGEYDTASEILDEIWEVDPENAWVYIGRYLIENKLESLEDLEYDESYDVLENSDHTTWLEYNEESRY